jgi:predicted  nucleic acid-binding Zn-ribbon protein
MPQLISFKKVSKKTTDTYNTTNDYSTIRTPSKEYKKIPNNFDNCKKRAQEKDKELDRIKERFSKLRTEIGLKRYMSSERFDSPLIKT